MMNYEEFKEKFTEDLKTNLEAKGHAIESIDIIPNEKLNQGAYDAITVRFENSFAGPSGNLTNLFGAYEQTNDYDFIKDKIALEAVNAEKNASMLDKIPHKRMEDIAIVYRAVLGQMDDGQATVLITNEMLEKMNVTKEQLHADAMVSAPEIKPVEVKTLFATIDELLPDFDLGLPAGEPEDQVLVATVSDKHHGAGVIAYENFLDNMAEKMGGGIVSATIMTQNISSASSGSNVAFSYQGNMQKFEIRIDVNGEERKYTATGIEGISN